MSTPNIAEFTTLKEITDDNITSLLYYGPSGCGKSWFAGTAGPRTLFFNIGNGIKTLKSPAFMKAYPTANEMIITTINEDVGASRIPSVAEALDKISDTIDFALKQFPEKFDTVVIDDASALRRFALIKGLEINQKLSKSKSLAMSKSVDLLVKAVQDFGVEMDLIEQFVAGYTVIFKDHGKHFIMTAHERNIFKKGDSIGEIPTLYKIKPGFTGQTFPDTVPAYFDWVFRAEVVNGSIFRARTIGDDLITAKCRDGGVFGSVETNPNFLTMLNKVANLKKGV